MKIYEITQTEKVLSCDEKIILGNKFDNIITKLHFTFDENVDELDGNKYVAMLDPQTNKFILVPMLSDDSILVGSNVTIHPGKWQILLMVAKDTILIEDITPQNAVYVSNVLKCVVRDNFLYEIGTGGDDLIDPNIQAWYLEALSLKGELQRYNDAIDRQYQKAVANGYDGTKEEWLNEHFEITNDVVEFNEDDTSAPSPNPEPDVPDDKEDQFDVVEF